MPALDVSNAVCQSCGDRPSTKQDPRDPNAYCDVCAARMEAEDYGEAYGAIKAAGFAMALLGDLIREPAELRRIANQLVDDVVSGNASAESVDVSEFDLKSRFEPYSGGDA